MPRSRAYRRHQYEKRKRRARDILRRRWGWSETELSPFRVGFTANTPQSCSCFMCGNPRKWWKNGLTKQELIAALNEKEQTPQ